MNRKFWKDKKVLVTGHTGFKGKWLVKILDMLGAKVIGYSLPQKDTDLKSMLNVSDRFTEILGDIRDISLLDKLKEYDIEIVIHLAAVSTLQEAQKYPIKTFETNVMGLVNLFSVLNQIFTLKVIVIVTSDKVYENIGEKKYFTEGCSLMGSEAYSCSKVCTEQVARAFFESFFKEKQVKISTARASNCYGGGDYNFNRLIPYLEKCRHEKIIPQIRNANSVRPWQYVLDILNGYLLLCEYLYYAKNVQFDSFNFGPSIDDCYTVGQIAQMICGEFDNADDNKLKEDKRLLLSSCKSKAVLSWKPIFDCQTGIAETSGEYQDYFMGISEQQIYTKHVNFYLENLKVKEKEELYFSEINEGKNYERFF